MAHRYLFQAEAGGHRVLGFRLSAPLSSPRLTVICLAEHGSIEDLASPVLSKIAEAFVFSKKSMFASDPTKGDGVLGEGSVVIGALNRNCCLCRCVA